jgi:hypothetical protein
MALATQRSGNARAASSGPTTLPKPRQADKFFCFFFFFLVTRLWSSNLAHISTRGSMQVAAPFPVKHL